MADDLSGFPSDRTGGTGDMVVLEGVALRLASAQTDQELTSVIGKYLPSCLLKLSSSQEGVRKRVLELLVHINKRVKANDKIQLPVDALMVQYQDPSASSFVLNFTILYIKMGFPRLPTEKQAHLIPSILSSLDGKPTSQQDALLLMIVPLLGEILPPVKDPQKKLNLLGLSERPGAAKMLNSFILDFLLLPYGSHPSQNCVQVETGGAGSSVAKDPPKAPAGMSETSWKRVAGDLPVRADVLEKRKCSLVKFLGQGFLSEMDAALPILVATADTRHSVVGQSDGVMRRFSGHIDWENSVLTAKLYRLFLGTMIVKDKKGRTLSAVVKLEDRKTPANTRIRLKLMPYLLRSREAALQFPPCIQVTFDLLFGTDGNSNFKLKTMAVQFVHHIIEKCPESRLVAIGAVLQSALTRLVNNQKDQDSNEPMTNAAMESASKLRGSCYVAIGKLGYKVPSLVNRDISILQTFFAAMSTENKETQLSVQESLSLMASSYKQMDAGNMTILEAMLGTYIEDAEPQVRLVTVQYAGEVFGPNHVASRFILLLGAGDRKEEVANEAKVHLYGEVKKYAEEDGKELKIGSGQPAAVLPEFFAMLQFVLDKAEPRVKSSQHKFEIGGSVLPFRPEVYVEMIRFLRMCLVLGAGTLPTFDMLNHPVEAAPKVTKFLASNSSQLTLKFLEFSEKLMRATQGPDQAWCMLQLVGCAPLLTLHFRQKLSWIKSLLSNTREDVREAVAHIYGIVAASLDGEQFEVAIQELFRGFKGKQLEFQHGAVVSSGYAFARFVRSMPNNVVEVWTVYKDTLELIVGQLACSQPLAMSGACMAIGELGRNGPLALSSKNGLVDQLLAMVKNGKLNMKVRERAALAVGQLCVGDAAFPLRDQVVQGFLDLMEDVKEVELHLTLGEALVHAVLGPLSPMRRDLWSTEESEFDHGLDDDDRISDGQLRHVLNQLTGSYMLTTHPNVKQASSIFLLAILTHGKSHDVVKNNLGVIQAAFMGLLGDNNDLIQDACSKGLGIVYEACSEDQRRQMCDNLLKTLLEGKREVQQVSADTKIFADGQLGKTPAGSNLTTYKELCSLASDLNQPDLVYKFMNLANHNAMWNSRRGAAFGFGTIAAKAGQQLEPYLHKIIPKLYRYQFDPTPKIRHSMQSIWDALVTDSSKTVDRYLRQILSDVCTNLTSNQWRVRESCCLALQDVLRGRSFDQVLDLLPNLWLDLFRVMDDIKESVRLAAGKTVGALSRNCVKLCDVNQSGAKTGEAAVGLILPVLLQKGLLSSVADVRAAALNIIVKITKSAGVMLKGHLDVLVPALLEATSELESSQVGYLSSRLANDVAVQEKLDVARIAAAKTSPLMDCVNYVVQFVDADALASLVPKLVDLIKTSAGLGTKGATAHVITTLTHQCALELQPHTSRLLSALVSGLSDRNPAVRKTYASAIGQLLKTAKDKSTQKLFVKLRSWYMDKGDEASRLSVAFTFQAISRHNPDKMKAHAAETMPIAFFAMHEELTDCNGDSLETWEEVWSDGTPGTEGGLRLYLKEIVSLLSVAIESPQWTVKAQAARSMGTVARKLGKNIPKKEQKQLMAMLLNGLAGRTWTGKDALLAALSDVCQCGEEQVKRFLVEDDDVEEVKISEKMLADCLLQQCQKDHAAFKVAALDATGIVFKFLQVDRFADLFKLFFPIIRQREAQDDDEVPSLELQLAVIQCLGRAWPTDPKCQQEHIVELLEALVVLVQATTRRNQLAICVCLGEMVSRWKPGDNDEIGQAVIVKVAKLLSLVLAIANNSQLRKGSLKVLGQVVKLLVDSQHITWAQLFRDEIANSLDCVIKDLGSDPTTKDAARQLKLSLSEFSRQKTSSTSSSTGLSD